jgi:fungal nitric oxide reductase
MVEPLFSRKHIDAMHPHIQKTVNSLLDTVLKGGCEKPVDLAEKFALPVPSYVSPFVLWTMPIFNPSRAEPSLLAKIIYGILGVPFQDLEYLTQCNAIRSNGSATASEASNANRSVFSFLLSPSPLEQ